jgi:hypothetical protein
MFHELYTGFQFLSSRPALTSVGGCHGILMTVGMA